MQDVYRRRHANGVWVTVTMDALGLGFEVVVCAPDSGERRLGAWWRLEDATRAADAAAHPVECGPACGCWERPAVTPLAVLGAPSRGRRPAA